MSDNTDTASPTGRLEPTPGDWQRVSGRYLIVDLVGTLVGWIALIVALAVAWSFTQSPLLIVAIVIAVLALIINTALVPPRVRSIGYRLRDDDLLFRRGLLYQRTVAVPYGRMQLVDVTRGPISRALGLAELKLVTAAAASGVQIPGLTLAAAEELRDHLVRVAESRRAGL